MTNQMSKHIQYYKRICDRCGSRFRPLGKEQAFCLDCNTPTARTRLIRNYEKQKIVKAMHHKKVQEGK